MSGIIHPTQAATRKTFTTLDALTLMRCDKEGPIPIEIVWLALERKKEIMTVPFIARKAAQFTGILGSFALIAGLASSASAQTYTGKGQALDIGVELVAGTVSASLASTLAGPLPTSGGGPLTATDATVGGTVTVVPAVMAGPITVTGATNLIVSASALSGFTAGSGGAVVSTAGIANVLTPNAQLGTNLNIGIQVLGGVTVNFLSAKAIQTKTYADASGKNSQTTIVGLRLTDVLGNVQTVAGVTLDGGANANLTFNDSDPTLGLSLTGIGTVALHEKLNAGNVRTTNAIDISLLNNGVLGNLANAHVTVASSTAGFASGAAAPEPGSLAMLLPALPVLGTVLSRRRRRAA